MHRERVLTDPPLRRGAEKELACGDVGTGAMMEWTQIVEIIKDRLKLPPLDTGAPRLELK